MIVILKKLSDKDPLTLSKDYPTLAGICEYLQWIYISELLRAI